MTGTLIGTGAGLVLSRVDTIGGVSHDPRVGVIGAAIGAWVGLISSAAQTSRVGHKVGVGTGSGLPPEPSASSSCQSPRVTAREAVAEARKRVIEMSYGGYGNSMPASGLDGVIAATTQLSHVDGERGELVIGGYQLDAAPSRATFRRNHLVVVAGGTALGRTARGIPSHACRTPDHSWLNALVASRMRATANRRHGCPADGRGDALACGGRRGGNRRPRVPTIVASYWRLRRGEEPLPPRSELGHAANFLYMLSGQLPDPERVRGLETYLNTVIDHGLNASTFTARVITSTGSDLVSAVTGALGALKGPLHGGAPGPALEMVFEIGDASRAESVLRTKIEAGEKLMGFGHRVYKVRDPRADVLARAAERLFTRRGDMSLYTLARAVEAEALRLLEEYKPGRRLQTNVEFYTALLLHGLGFGVELFTPTFAISRVSGWIAHASEQRRANRIIRPQSEYTLGRARGNGCRWRIGVNRTNQSDGIDGSWCESGVR